MRHLSILLMVFLFANTSFSQNNNYSKLWQEAERFEIDGLPKSALKIVKTIETKAKKESNSAQLIKTLLFKSKFAIILEEDALLKVIIDFKTEIKNSKTPTKNVLENMLATLYWQYFNQNRWQFYNRSKTKDKVNEQDFRTWDLQTLFNEIHTYYNSSLNNGLLLQQTPLKQYNVLLNKKKDSKIYRPTLFDLLSHNALEFYKTTENNITKPAYKFIIDNPNFIAEAGAFSKLKITSKDTSSLQLNALKIYQNLIQFHLKDKTPFALTDVNIDRLLFVKQHATFSNKEELLLKAFKNEVDRHKTHEISGAYNFQIAKIYNEQANTYNPKDIEPKHHFKNKEALTICESVIGAFPDSRGAKLCEVLKLKILSPSISITAESYIPKNIHSKLLINYKNIDQLNFSAYKITQTQLKTFNKTYREDEKEAFINKLNTTVNWQSDLINESDYQNHTIETLVPELGNGIYIIKASTTNLDKTIWATSIVQSTNIAVIETEDEDENFYQFIDRNNGEPLTNTKVKLEYFYGNAILETKTTTTSAKGIISIKKKKETRRNLNFTVYGKSDTAYLGNFYLNRRYFQANQDKTQYQSFVFTDRSIYRPGQTVYFKAIALKTKNNTSQVLANEKVYATLLNVNDDEVAELNLVTNEFGSVSGEFILPSGGLTGEYYIEFDANSNKDMSTEHYFSVEEYKRPKFETNFKPITETFKVNDSIKVTVEAIAFSGSKITDAKVVYRVKRNVQYPRWYSWYRPSFYSQPQEITQGETTTDKDGNYNITFKAIPDESVDKKGLPVFNYEVTADVTDINGETRSTSTIVKVGYHALTATLSVSSKLDKTKKDHQITITTNNLNGEFVATKGTVKIYKLQSPNNVLRSRPWGAPDYKNFTKEEYNKLFPHEAYAEEDNPEKWQKGELILDQTFNTEKSKTLDLKNIKRWDSGAHIILLKTQDKFGQDVKDEAKTTLFSPKDKMLADKQLFSITTNQNTYNVGDYVELTLATAAKNMTATVTVEKAHNIVDTYILQLDENKSTVKIPVTKNDLGGFAIAYSYAMYNNYKSGNLMINVPYPTTQLDIETVTFRDKLQPGQDETWSFKIKGENGEKVTSELLASMYDASLDEFKQHNWNFSPHRPSNYYSYRSRNARNSFGSTNFRIFNNRNYYNYPNSIEYDALNWFGLSLRKNNWQYNQYLNRLRIKYAPKIESTYNSKLKKGTVVGTVYGDDGLPLPGVNIIVKGTTTGASTDFDGNFSIQVKKGDVLELNYVGFVSKKITIDKDNTLVAYMVSDDATLDEVVVMAYGTKSKATLSYGVEDAEMEPNANFSQTLQGQVAGLNISSGVGRNFRDGDTINLRGVSSLNGLKEPLFIVDGVPISEAEFKKLNANDISGLSILKDASATAIYGSRGANGVVIITTKKGAQAEDFTKVKARKNLQETAFFFPHLTTDKNGDVSFNFTTPEALTRWNLNLFAHDKQANSAKTTLQTVTQKELMVIPNAPRFLRQGDQINISTKIANLTDKALTVTAVLQLFDALTGNKIDSELNNSDNQKAFTVDAKGNTQATWTLNVSDDIQAIQYKILATTGDFSDGEQNALPVLTNRMLVTETLPMWIKSNETKTFTLDKLKTNTSTTLKNHKLTLEMTSNPAWYAVQSLPYLMEYPYECNEQTFSRFYANALASHIVNSNPKIQAVFNQWASQDALISNLEKNQELKSILIQETPWLRDAQSETEQKKRIALLFDLNKMNSELTSAKLKLQNNQMSSGAWSWFGNYRENRYITQHIIAGFGHLKQLGVIKKDDDIINDMIEDAIDYLDKEFVEEYNDITKYNNKVDLTKEHISYMQLHYMYMRSFFLNEKQSTEVKKVSDYYQSQISKYWLKRSLYSKGMMALISHRNKDETIADKILKSLKENSITSDELGMYWKANTSSWYWYQAPIETQALLIEAFSEIENDTNTIDNLKTWLLKNKQTNRWKTTKATTEAVYALLLQGSDWLSVTDAVDVVLGGQKIEPSKLEDVKVEAGTGYFKTSWNATEIKPEMAEVKLTKKGKGIAWGSLYWQYFEDLDKISSAETPLKLKKKLFKKTNTDKGEVITDITKDTKLEVGDLVRVRIELRSDRNMEFVHMKDMRAAGLEPINVLSQYKHQDGLGYYESTKDASTNFFFDYLPKGIYVFEYDLRVNNAGNMSNGITTIQSMYAPEYTSHSEGVRVTVE